MKKSFFRFLCLGVLTLTGLIACAQNLNPLNLTNIIPSSPEVSSLGKYMDMPVSYSSGIPSIQIPLYSIQNGYLNVPLNLSYNAGGIRVEEAATWTGLGWTLNAGGNISRVVHGLPDDYDTTNGYMYTANKVHYIMSLPRDSSTRVQLLLYDAGIYQTLDVEPDEYIYSVMGYSGKFYFDQQAERFVQTPYSAVKISTVTNSAKQITGFVLTLPNGVKCYFGTSEDASRTAWEYFESQSSVNYNEHSGYSLPPSGTSIPHITSWQLLDIVSPANKAIRFYYTSYESVDYGRGGESVDYAINGATCPDPQTGQNLATEKKNLSFYEQASIKSKLSRISTDVSDVWFKAATHLRQDVMANEYTLDTILVNDKNNNLIKGFTLSYGYFASTDNSGINIQNFYAMYNSPATVAGKRLRLDSLHEFSNGISVPSFKFYYNTSHLLPDKLSAAQDFWGFYNGKANGYFTIPSIPTSLLVSGGSGLTSGADRTVDVAYSSAGVLNKVVYPTGGSTQYFYESNLANTGRSNLGAVGYQYSGLINKTFFFWNNPVDYHNTVPFETYVDSFDIGAVSGQANIVTTGCSNYNSLDCPFTINITGITNPSFSLFVNSGNFNFTLAQGRYKITASVRSPSDFIGFNLDVHWSEFSQDGGSGGSSGIHNTVVGGLRIRKIVSLDSTGNGLFRSFDYKSYADSSASSGELMHTPVFIYKIDCGNEGEAEVGSWGQEVTRIVSNSALPLTFGGGEVIRYKNVTEYQDTARTAIKTEMEFSNDYYNYIDPASSTYPYPSNVERNWRKDLLLEKRQYSNIGVNTYLLLTDQKNFYTEYEVATNDTFGIIISPLLEPNSFSYKTYNFVTEWYLLDSTVTLTFPANGSSPLVQSTKYFYDAANDYTVANERSVNSKGHVIDKKSWYILDFNAGSGYPVSSLTSKNIIDNPLRQELSDNGKLVNGQVITYYETGLPKDVYQLENASLMDTSTFNPNVMVPSNYSLRQTAHYNSSGNTNQINTVNNITRAFLWDYSNSYPICSIVNADTSTVAYTSFEADGKGNWSFSGSAVSDNSSPTGLKCYSLTAGDITKTGLSTNTTYVVTYWKKDGTSTVTVNGNSATGVMSKNGWTLYNLEVTGTTAVTVSGTSYIDELRLYPKAAMMTTYTYQPVVGLTSKCDENNRISYYEYDSLGRLKLIKDQDKNILRRIDYQYQVTPQQ